MTLRSAEIANLRSSGSPSMYSSRVLASYCLREISHRLTQIKTDKKRNLAEDKFLYIYSRYLCLSVFNCG